MTRGLTQGVVVWSHHPAFATGRLGFSIQNKNWKINNGTIEALGGLLRRSQLFDREMARYRLCAVEPVTFPT